MVSAKIKIFNMGNKNFKEYVLFYIVENFDPVPIVIGGELYHDKVATLKDLVRANGGANHIKKEILIGNVPLQNGVYLYETK